MEKLISLLLPTRGRPDLANQFIKSVVDTADHVDTIEIALCIDEDDESSKDITNTNITIVKKEVKPGLFMGALYLACYSICSGKYIMLVNDDIIIHTKGWDTIILDAFASVGDDIALIHVNDLLFEEKLCTFPMQSRKAIENIGLCNEYFQRYRIDDHCYDTYCLLAELGYKRILYLPDVIFEHENYAVTSGESTEFFTGSNSRIYVPNQEILKKDADLFDSLIDKRKENAAKMACIIEKSSNIHDKIGRLATIHNSNECRRKENISVIYSHELANVPGSGYSLTIGIVTADIQQLFAFECLNRVKKYTRNFDLILLDNNRSKNFNHAREMNKIIRSCTTDFLILLDDDVFVGEGWVEGMMKAMTPDVALVTPLFNDAAGMLSYAGVKFLDDQGNHGHIFHHPARPFSVYALCSACLLIDLKKMRSCSFLEKNSKYFHDLDYALQAWEKGYRCVVSPYATVTHLGGATIEYGSEKNNTLWQQDRQIFLHVWQQTGRYAKLKEEVWPRYKDLELFAKNDENVGMPSISMSSLEAHIPFNPILMRENLYGFNIILVNKQYFGIMQADGELTREKILNNVYRPCLVGETLNEVLYQINNIGLLKIYWYRIKRYIRKFLK